MSIDFHVLVAILVMAGATALTRLSGVFVVRHLSVTPQTAKALDAIPPAVLMAVVAPTALATGWAEFAGCLVTALTALRLSLLPCIAIGVACVAGLRTLGF